MDNGRQLELGQLALRAAMKSFDSINGGQTDVKRSQTDARPAIIATCQCRVVSVMSSRLHACLLLRRACLLAFLATAGCLIYTCFSCWTLVNAWRQLVT